MKRHIWPVGAGILFVLTLLFAALWVRTVLVRSDDIRLYRSNGHSAVMNTAPGLLIINHYSFSENDYGQYFEFQPRPWWRIRRPSADTIMLLNWIWDSGGFYVNFGEKVTTDSQRSIRPAALLDRIVLPLWGLTLLCAIAPGYWLTRFLMLRHHRIQEGLCPSCGFELLDGEDECPECGRSLGKQAFA
jgi:hypothetical protein